MGKVQDDWYGLGVCRDCRTLMNMPCEDAGERSFSCPGCQKSNIQWMAFDHGRKFDYEPSQEQMLKQQQMQRYERVYANWHKGLQRDPQWSDAAFCKSIGIKWEDN